MAHTYTAQTIWERGQQVFTDGQYSRAHLLRFDGGIDVPGSSSPLVVPLPMSLAQAVDPEEAFVSALSSCHMLWFLGLAARRGWCVDRYHDQAEGLMARNTENKLAMTVVTLRPCVWWSGPTQPDAAQIEALHHEAHEACFIANSVKTEVRVEAVQAPTPAPAPTPAHGQAPSERARVSRASERGHYDQATIEAIVDEAWVCQVAFACPDILCLPTACWRVGDKLYIHGSNGSRMMKHLSSGAPACVSITHLDGMVMARSAFSHSMNFRSVVIHGAFEVVADADKPAILHALVEHIAKGRAQDARPADRHELAATTVLGISLHEAAAKIRAGGPLDKEGDMALPVWAGVLPLRLQHRPAQPEPDQTGPLPAYVANWADDAAPGKRMP